MFSAADAGDRHHRWFVEHDPPALYVDQGVCGAEIDRHVGRQQTQHSSNHITANPKPRVIPRSDLAPGYPRESCLRPTNPSLTDRPWLCKPAIRWRLSASHFAVSVSCLTETARSSRPASQPRIVLPEEHSSITFC